MEGMPTRFVPPLFLQACAFGSPGCLTANPTSTYQVTMAIENIVTDPSLQSILQTSQSTLAQALAVIDWLTQQPEGQIALEQQLELAQQQKVLHAYLAKLRGQSRRAAFGARSTKQDTAEARQEVDRLLLQLQNLYYEQRHLMGEIDACEGYE